MRNFLLKLKRFLILALIVGAVFGLYLFALNYQITSKFEYHRWNLPSRIYSDSTFIFRGKTLTPRALEDKLIALGYKKVPEGRIYYPGEYHRGRSGFLLYLHDFEYSHESTKGVPLLISWDGPVIQSIERLDTHTKVNTLKLEPERIASLFDEKMEDRTLVKLSEVPQNLIDGIIAIEDERFYKHHGVDPIGILRALLTDIIKGRLAQGGSTLTQQLVKNFFLTSKKSFVRKFNEVWMALLLERRYSKEEILESYLNEIYLGQNGPASVTGVGEGSRHYFGKNIQHLSLAESAQLAGMVRSPGEYSPFNHPDRAVKRRNLVLKAMLDKEFIDKKDYTKAVREKIVAPKRRSNTEGAPYFVDLVKQQLRENFSAETLAAEGHKIFTTLDLELQRSAEAALSRGLNHLEESVPLLKENKAQGKSLEGALIAITPQTGYLRAYVGGRDYTTSQFNRPIQAFRQPGSAFKPFVYLSALDPKTGDGKFTVASPLEDEPITLETPEGPWTPKNYDEETHGTVTLREALEKSYNIATVRLAGSVGLDRVIETAKRAGIQSPMRPFPSLALGAFEVTPLELAEAYSIFPNGGTRSRVLAIRHLATKEGEVLESKEIKMKRAFDEGPIYLMNSLLEGVFERGTASVAKQYGFQGVAGGKTGTTSDYKDAWFVGYTPDLLALVWVGYDDGSPMGLSSAQAALPIWVDFMKNQFSSEDLLATPPDSIIFKEVDPLTGLKEPFIKGTEPIYFLK